MQFIPVKMWTVWRNLVDNYNYLMVDLRDRRVDGWLLMDSPWPTLLICLLYVVIVTVIGPKFMKDRKPFQFRKILVLYNFFQVIFSTWIFYKLSMGGWLTGEYNWRCQPVDYSDNPTAILMVHASWWYFISKFTEFFDTFFFVLRKKQEHVSLLHVVHHGCMPMSVWFGVKFTPGGHSTFFGFLNTFVHIVMYFYYMMSAMGPRVHKYLWWKKYLTTFQMVQFIGIFLHAFQLLFTDCNYPRAFIWWIGGHAVMFFALFSDFYIKAYLRTFRKKPDKSNQMLLSNGVQNGILHKNGLTKLSNGYSNGHITNGYPLSNGVKHRHVNGAHSSDNHVEVCYEKVEAR